MLPCILRYAMDAVDERYHIASSYQREWNINRVSINQCNKLYRGKTIPSNVSDARIPCMGNCGEADTPCSP
jgi:hypothetical protein